MPPVRRRKRGRPIRHVSGRRHGTVNYRRARLEEHARRREAKRAGDAAHHADDGEAGPQQRGLGVAERAERRDREVGADERGLPDEEAAGVADALLDVRVEQRRHEERDAQRDEPLADLVRREPERERADALRMQSLQLAQIAEKRSRSDNDMTPLEMVINRDLLVTMKSGKYGQALPMIG